jgi:hypothetical protein
VFALIALLIELSGSAQLCLRLEKTLHEIRDISVGRSDYSMADFAEDVKCSYARECLAFDNDTFNKLGG